MNRRDFLARAGLVATWAGIAVTVGCGDEGGGGTGPESGSPESVAGSVTGGGHSHSVSITNAQIVAGQSVVLTLSGSGHTHTVTLTADQVVRIGNSEQVAATSTSSDGHFHTVTFG